MKINKNSQLMNRMRQLQIEVLESGHAFLDPSWNFENIFSPFSRLYYIKDGDGLVEFCGHKMPFRPGYAYLLPAGLAYSCKCAGTMEKWYFHIHIRMPNGFDLFQGCEECYEMKICQEDMESLSTLYESSDLEDVFYLQALLQKTAAGLIQLAGMKELHNYSLLLQNVFACTEERLSSSLTVEELAQTLHVSRSTLAKRFKRETGMSVGSYLNQMLLNRACQLLLTTDWPISYISDTLNFCDQFYFSRYFKQHQGETPSSYRRRMKHVTSE